MKKIIYTLVLSLLGLSGYAQTWSVGSGTLFTNPSTTKVGVGITPTELFHIDGGALKIGNGYDATSLANNVLKFGDANHVKIGEWEADDLLSFYARVGYSFTGGAANFSSNLTIGGQFQLKSTHITFGHSGGDGVINFGNSKGNLYFRSLTTAGNTSPYNELMLLTYDGKLGIGRTDPQRKLDVNGDIGGKGLFINHTTTSDWAIVSEINVNRNLTRAFLVRNTVLDKAVFAIYGSGIVCTKKIYAEAFEITPNAMEISWFDHVFAQDYKLRPLSEVEQFIQENKHLPEIPSEKEVKENGFNLGDMQGKLLMKIEELTLYLIEQQKQTIEQQQFIEELQKRLSELENREGGK